MTSAGKNLKRPLLIKQSYIMFGPGGFMFVSDKQQKQHLERVLLLKHNVDLDHCDAVLHESGNCASMQLGPLNRAVKKESDVRHSSWGTSFVS